MTETNNSTNEIKSILWATDFSKESKNCLAYIKMFSKALHTKNHALFVLPKFSDWVYETAFISNEELLVTVENARQKSREDILHAAKRPGIVFETDVREGIASTEIIHYAIEKNIDLVFAGRRGDSEIEHILIGSTSSRLTRNSTVPVCIVPKTTHDRMIERILCPLDFSEFSWMELDFAIMLAKGFNAELFVVHISEFFNYKIPVFNRDMLLDKIDEKITQIGDAHHYKIQNIIYDTGEPAHKIMEIAKKNKVDIITMASHQRKGIEKLFLGSITEKVLMYSNIPVIVLPPDHE